MSIGATIGSYRGRVSVPGDSYGRAMKEECKVEYCERLAYTRGFCQMHYRRVMRTGDAGPPGSLRQRRTCSVVGCEQLIDAKELCHGHYQRLLRHGDVGDAPLRSSGRLCSVPDCGRPHKAFGYCAAHYKRFLASGNPQADRPIREVAGEGFLNHGYWIVPVPKTLRSLVGGASSIGEHRLVVARHLGRALRSDEVVHHRNGDRADNRIENLELWLTSHPKGQRVEDVVAFSIEMLARYAPEIGSWAVRRTIAS
jgi:hypothetical protein